MQFRTLRTLLLAIIVTFGLIACSEEESSGQATWYNRNTLYSYDAAHGNLWDHLRRNLSIPNYTYTARVQKQIHWYQNHQDYLNHVIAESAPYIYYIYQQTQKKGLPADLALIPVIESEYNPYARSSVGAEGLWQIMPANARGFGLKRDRWYNGSRDIMASTNAALQYFAYLHTLFKGNWLLAIAAYDCGEGRVMGAIRYNQLHHRSTDFWNLPLPNETRDYVPRLLAVAAIVRNPGYYHIHLAPINDAPYIEQVNVGSQMSLSKAAQLADVPVTTMKVLNPALQHGTTDPKGPYTLIVPTDKAETFREKLAALTENGKLLLQQHYADSKEKFANLEQKYHTNVTLLRDISRNKGKTEQSNQTSLAANTNTVAPDVSTEPASQNQSAAAGNNDNNPLPQVRTIETLRTYKVAHGDTLNKIAAKNNISLKELMAWNKISRHHKLRLGQALVVAKPGSSTIRVADNENKNSPSTTKNNADETVKETTQAIQKATNAQQTLPISYEVLNGDDLNKIAQKFHTTTTAIRQVNNLASNTVKVGQVLTIPSKENNNSLATIATPATQNTKATKRIYIVRKGDYFEKIAKHVNISEADLKKWNPNLSDANLHPGQKLVIENPESSVASNN